MAYYRWRRTTYTTFQLAGVLSQKLHTDRQRYANV